MKEVNTKEMGFTIVELMVVVSIIALISFTATANLKILDDPLRNATSSSLIFLQLARAKAISNTSYIRVYPSFEGKIITAFGSDCDTATDIDPAVQFELPNGTRLVQTDWSICFTPRGFSRTNISFKIIDNSAKNSIIEVALGGGAKKV